SRAQSISPPPQSFPPSVTHPMLNHFDPRGFHFGTTPPANSRDLTSREYHHFYPHAIHPSSSSNTSSLCHSHNPHTTQTVYNPHSLQRDSPVTDSTSQQPPIINNWISSSSSMSMSNATGAASTTVMHAHHHAHPNNMFIVPHQMSTGTGVASQTHSHSQHAHGSQNMYIVPSMSLVHANCSSPSTSPSSLSQASLSPLSQTSLSPLSQTPQTPVHSPSSRLTMNSPSRVASKLLSSPSTLSHSLFPESHLSPTSSDPRSLISNSNLYLPPAISSSSSSSSANSPSSPSRNKHKCEWPGCTWSFKRLEHLKRHNLTHTGERKYKCEHPGCGKKFGRSDNFAAHLKTHNKNCNAVNNGTNNG
ncbi:4573_t:CDS:2, partial [Acaulospora morrowiae]